MSFPQPKARTFFSDEDWKRLIRDIGDGNVIPIIGPGLLIHGEDATRTLQDHLLRQLCPEVGLSADKLEPGYSLLDLCSHHEIGRQRWHGAIWDRMVDLQWPVPLPLRQLAAIRKFDLYVSTTFDTLLFEAVESIRAGARELLYGFRRKPSDLDPRNPSAPSVFQIFGQLDGTGDCALSEEDILDFTQRLQDPDLRPEEIFQLLGTRNLLFLGCGYSGWLGRFFRRVLRANSDLRDSGWIAQKDLKGDAGYVLFLERQGAKLWVGGSEVGFVQELHDRWTAVHPESPGQRPTVFLSYAREDERIAMELRDRFAKHGIVAWLDLTTLRAGEAWWRKIQAAIFECPVFLPLISENSHPDNGTRTVHEEWEEALRVGQIEGAPGARRIAPLNSSARRLPGEFQSLHVVNIQNKDRLVEDVANFLARGAK